MDSKYGTREAPTLYLGGENLSPPGNDDPSFSANVMNFLREHATSPHVLLAETKFGPYAASLRKRDASGTEQGGGVFYATENFISFEPTTHRISNKGLEKLTRSAHS